MRSTIILTSQAANLSPWPPAPIKKSGLHPCKATPAKTVGYELCTNVTTSPGRNRHCKGCPCPWRVCTACTLQRATASDIRDVDPKTGLCVFHQEHGTDAVRPADYEREKLVALPNISIADAIPTVPDEEAPVPEAPVLTLEEEQAAMEGYAEIARARFSKRKFQIMELLAKGVKRPDIADLLGTKNSSIISTINIMGHMLQVPAYPGPGTRTDYVSGILAKLHQHMRGHPATKERAA